MIEYLNSIIYAMDNINTKEPDKDRTLYFNKMLLAIRIEVKKRT